MTGKTGEGQVKKLFICYLLLLTNSLLFSGEKIEVNYLDEIIFNFPGKLLISQGDKNTYLIEGDSQSIKELKVSGHGGSLVFEKKELQIGPTHIKDLTVHVTVKNLLKLHTEGAVFVEFKELTENKLSLDILGHANLTGKITLKEFYANFSGDSTVNLEGAANIQEVEFKGSASYNASKLKSQDVKLVIQGSSKVMVNATEELSVVIAGSATVIYSGNPKKVEKNITGSGIVKRAS